MRPFPRLLSALLAAGVVAGAVIAHMWPEKPLRVVTQVYKPYQDERDGRIIGPSVDIMRCALDSVGRPYTVEIVRGEGWAEAQAKVRRGDMDLFFGALHSQERDTYASWSASLGEQHTYFIKRADNPIDRKDPAVRWGVKKGSGIAAQAETAMLNIAYVGTDNPEVVKALWERKVDYIYMDWGIFLWGVEENGIHDAALANPDYMPDFPAQSQHFHVTPVASQLYGAYVSREWLAKHGGLAWMEKLNNAIGACRQKQELGR